MRDVEDPLVVEEEVPIRDRAAVRAGVDSVIGQTFPLVNGVVSPTGFRSFLLAYDRSGRRVRHEKFGRDGAVVRRWLYDDAGTLVQEIAYGAAGHVEYRLDVVHDRDGWKEKLMYSGPGRLHYRIAARRDAGGRLTEALYLDAHRGTIRSDIYAYDAAGRLVHVTMSHGGECRYDYEGNDVKRRSRTLPGASERGDVQEFAHDDRGLLVRMTHLHASVTTFAVTVA